MLGRKFRVGDKVKWVKNPSFETEALRKYTGHWPQAGDEDEVCYVDPLDANVVKLKNFRCNSGMTSGLAWTCRASWFENLTAQQEGKVQSAV